MAEVFRTRRSQSERRRATSVYFGKKVTFEKKLPSYSKWGAANRNVGRPVPSYVGKTVAFK